MRSWQAADAKQNFSRLVEAAKDGPQVVLRHSEPVGVMLSMDHYETLKALADAEFARFLIATPLKRRDVDKDVGMRLADG